MPRSKDPLAPPAAGARPVWISLGSNIRPREMLPRALRRLVEALAVEAVSRVWETEPVEAPGAPGFLNAALRGRTDLDPDRLKHRVLRPIEAALGRLRTADRNAPRTIDLDIALYDRLVLSDGATGLEIPDPEILTRAHVALPLADLDPDLAHPVTGETLGSIARRLAGGAAQRPIAGPGLEPFPRGLPEGRRRGSGGS